MTTPKSVKLYSRGRSRRTMQRRSGRLNKIQKFDVGTMVRKEFHGEFYVGKVVKVVKNVWRSLSARDPQEVFFPVMYKIKYSDGDREEMDEKEVEEHLFELIVTEDQPVPRDVDTIPDEQPFDPSRNAGNLNENGNQGDDRHQHHEEIVHGGPSMVTDHDYTQDSCYSDIDYRWFISDNEDSDLNGHKKIKEAQTNQPLVFLPDAIMVNDPPDNHSCKSVREGRGFTEIGTDLSVEVHQALQSTNTLLHLVNTSEMIQQRTYDQAFYSLSKSLSLLVQWKTSWDAAIASSDLSSSDEDNPEKKRLPKAKLDNLSNHLNDENQQLLGNRPGSKPAELNMKAEIEKLIEKFDGLGLNSPLSDSSSSDEDSSNALPHSRKSTSSDRNQDDDRHQHHEEIVLGGPSTVTKYARNNIAPTSSPKVTITTSNVGERHRGIDRGASARNNSAPLSSPASTRYSASTVYSSSSSPRLFYGYSPPPLCDENFTPPVDEKAVEEKEASIPNDKEANLNVPVERQQLQLQDYQNAEQDYQEEESSFRQRRGRRRRGGCFWSYQYQQLPIYGVSVDPETTREEEKQDNPTPEPKDDDSWRFSDILKCDMVP